MHPDLLESLVRDRITELRGGRTHRSAPAGPEGSRGSRGSRRSRRWASTGRAHVGRLFVRLGTSLIGEGAGHPVRYQALPEAACSTR
ncbi:MAG TPA: hypothetical protein VGD55_05060 [Acidothermaceae bacterium]